MQTYRNGMFQVGLALAQGDITPDTPDREVARRYKGEATKHRYLQQLQADGHGLHIRWGSWTGSHRTMRNQIRAAA